MFSWLQSLDVSMAKALHTSAAHSPTFDSMVAVLTALPLRLMPFMAALWAMWFAAQNRADARRLVIQALVAGAIALVLSRMMQGMLPYRPRPFHNSELGLVIPPEMGAQLQRWSSFPSDHAAMVFALLTPVFAKWWKLGAALVFWALAMVCLPRLYIGFHYPLDLIGGAVFGVFAAIVVGRLDVLLTCLTRWAPKLEQRWPSWFYGTAFMVTFEVAFMLEDVRSLMRSFGHAV
jgi:undecaprenyl-diphosphatase